MNAEAANKWNLSGGNVSPKGQTETWNGSAWTEVNDLNTVGTLIEVLDHLHQMLLLLVVMCLLML